MHLNEKCHRLIGSKLLDEGYFINRVHMLAYRNLTAFSFFRTIIIYNDWIIDDNDVMSRIS